jgi:hypothetical protein
MRDSLEQKSNGGKPKTNYNNDINRAERARNNQKRDTMPGTQEEGYLGMDDIDKLRRRKISKIY